MVEDRRRRAGNGFHQKRETVKPSRKGATLSTGVQNAKVGVPLMAPLVTPVVRNPVPSLQILHQPISLLMPVLGTVLQRKKPLPNQIATLVPFPMVSAAPVP